MVTELLAQTFGSNALGGDRREVIEACRRGHRDAFRALFEAYQDHVYSIALRYSGDPAAALDIAQETFLKVLSRIQEFRGEADVETWIYRIAVNACLDHRRRARRLVLFRGDLIDAISTRSESVLHRLMRVEKAEEVQRVVGRLPAEQRMVVVLRYTEALSYGEIARILRCSAGTVASRLNRAHKVLARRLSHLRGVVGVLSTLRNELGLIGEAEFRNRQAAVAVRQTSKDRDLNSC